MMNLKPLKSETGAVAHTHNGDVLQMDGVSSDGGSFGFNTTGAVTFNQNILVNAQQIKTTYEGSWMSISMRLYRDRAYGLYFTNEFARGSSTVPAIVQNGDTLSSCVTRGYDSAAFIAACSFEVQVDGAPGVDNMPGRFVFKTAPIDDIPQARMTIDKDGMVFPGSDNAQDLGKVGAADYRWRHLYLSGNLSDETNELTVANAKAAYDHVSNDGTDHADVVTNTTNITTNVTAIGLNTTHRGLVAGNPHSVTPTELSLVIGTNTQAHGDVLDDLNTLGAPASDGQFIVATGAGAFAYENTTTARTSLGIGEADSPAFAACNLGTGELTCGNINRAADTLKLKIGGIASLTIASTSLAADVALLSIRDSTPSLQLTDTDVTKKILFVGSDGHLEIRSFDSAAWTSPMTIRNAAPDDTLYISASGNIGLAQIQFGTNATKTFSIATGVAPTNSRADCFQIYSADIAPGHAAPYIRNENGTIIKLYQQAHIADATTQDLAGGDTIDETKLESDLAGIVAAINALYVIFENNGLLASV